MPMALPPQGCPSTTAPSEPLRRLRKAAATTEFLGPGRQVKPQPPGGLREGGATPGAVGGPSHPTKVAGKCPRRRDAAIRSHQRAGSGRTAGDTPGRGGGGGRDGSIAACQPDGLRFRGRPAARGQARPRTPHGSNASGSTRLPSLHLPPPRQAPARTGTLRTGVRYSATSRAFPFTVLMTFCMLPAGPARRTTASPPPPPLGQRSPRRRPPRQHRPPCPAPPRQSRDTHPPPPSPRALPAHYHVAHNVTTHQQRRAGAAPPLGVCARKAGRRVGRKGAGRGGKPLTLRAHARPAVPGARRLTWLRGRAPARAGAELGSPRSRGRGGCQRACGCARAPAQGVGAGRAARGRALLGGRARPRPALPLQVSAVGWESGSAPFCGAGAGTLRGGPGRGWLGSLVMGAGGVQRV